MTSANICESLWSNVEHPHIGLSLSSGVMTCFPSSNYRHVISTEITATRKLFRDYHFVFAICDRQVVWWPIKCAFFDDDEVFRRIIRWIYSKKTARLMLQISYKLFAFYLHRNADGSWALEPKQKSLPINISKIRARVLLSFCWVCSSIKCLRAPSGLIVRYDKIFGQTSDPEIFF